MTDFVDRQATMNAVGLTTDAINFNPTKYVDAQGNELVAVVRCKDCKHSGQCTKEIVMRMRVGSYTYCPMGSDGFCSWGERREDAEPVRHGHWIENDNGTYSCSECHSWIPNEQHYYARYCLFCGAKMDETEERLVMPPADGSTIKIGKMDESTMGQVKPSDGERKEDETD